jgi:hypothetical protein
VRIIADALSPIRIASPHEIAVHIIGIWIANLAPFQLRTTMRDDA